MSSITINDLQRDVPITIDDLPNEVIGEVFKKSEMMDRLSMRQVCKKWNEVSKAGHMPSPEIMSTLLQFASIPVSEVEKEVGALANRASRLDTVQNNMEHLCVAAAATSIGSVVCYHIPEFSNGIEAWNKGVEEEVRRDAEIMAAQQTLCDAHPYECALARYGYVNPECTIL